MSAWHPEGWKITKDMSWSLALCQLSQGNAKNIPFAGLCVCWETNAHRHRCPSHRLQVSYLPWCRGTLQLPCKSVRAEEKPFSSVSGLVLGLVSPVLETEEMKPNPMCVFRCCFWWAGEVRVLHWKRLWFLDVASGFCESPSRGACVRVSAFIVTGFKKFFQYWCLQGKKNTQQLGGMDP